MNDLVEKYLSADARFDPPPLKGLDDGDWSAVTHAHGEATDVPALLRALASENANDRQFAGLLLFETIWHQGDVYEATAEAIPFLYNLLEADGPQDKARVAHLLAAIATGHSPFGDCKEDPQETEFWQRILSKDGRSLEVEIARCEDYIEDIRQRILSRVDLLYPYLRHPIPEIRRSVTVAIGRFPDVVARIFPELESALKGETDKYVREALQMVTSRRTNG